MKELAELERQLGSLATGTQENQYGKSWGVIS